MILVGSFKDPCLDPKGIEYRSVGDVTFRRGKGVVGGKPVFVVRALRRRPDRLKDPQWGVDRAGKVWRNVTQVVDRRSGHEHPCRTSDQRHQ